MNRRTEVRLATPDGRIALRQGGLASVHAAPGTLMLVEEGKVWLTQCDDLRDHVLGSGDCFTLNGRGLAGVEALEPATVRLCAPGCRSSPFKSR